MSDTPTGRTVSEAREALGYIPPEDFPEFSDDLARLIAAVRTEERKATLAEVRKVVEDVEVDCSTCHCATPYSSEDPVAYCNRCVALREFRHALYAAIDALSSEGK